MHNSKPQQKRSVFPAEIEAQIQSAMKQIRSWDKNSQPSNCCICGNYQIVAELHHVISVRELAERWVIDQKWIEDYWTVWLCPNHHRLVHLLERLEHLPTDKKYNYVWYECLNTRERDSFTWLFELVETKRLELYAVKQVVS